MDTAQAFIMGERYKYCELMIFDWHKAAKIIKERKPEIARAGLRSDWEYTGGTIYEDGHIVKDPCTFLASTWAVPELYIDGEIIPCYIMESKNVNGWHEETRWPQSALDILKEEVLNMDNQKVVALELFEGSLKNTLGWIEGCVLPFGFNAELTIDSVKCINSMVYDRIKQYEGCRVCVCVGEVSMVAASALVAAVAAGKDLRIRLSVYYAVQDPLGFVPQEV